MSNFYDEVCEYSYSTPVTENFAGGPFGAFFEKIENAIKENAIKEDAERRDNCKIGCYKSNGTDEEKFKCAKECFM
jgi:hypothetical protein